MTMAMVHYLRQEYPAAQAELDKGRQLGAEPPQEFETALKSKANP